MKFAVTTLASCVAALLALGMVMLYSSQMTHSGGRFLAIQMIGCGLGLVGCVAVTLADYRWLKKFWWLLFGGALALLVLVLIPGIGTVHGGARRWFDFGRISFQPSEFAKIALIIAVAWYGEHYQRQMGTWLRGIIVPGLMVALVGGLLFKEPDVGNALVAAVVSGMMLILAGISMKKFLLPALLCALAVGLFIYHNPMRSDRVYSWLHLEETKLEKGHQAYQAMLALGAGGVTGLGLGNGRQKLGFIPQHHTDFIFSIIGEELGLIATMLVVGAFLVIMICGICISARAPDMFGFLLGCGITFLIGLQAFVNIGVVTSALPNKGLPLPFISYGGSNVMVTLTCVGLLFSIARRARSPQTARSLAAEDASLDRGAVRSPRVREPDWQPA